MGRMYGRINPVRPWASCTVATPSSPSVRMTPASLRSIRRTIVGFTRCSKKTRLQFETGINLPSVSLENFLLVFSAEPRRLVEILLGVVVIAAGFRIDASYRADHLRSEQDVVHGHDFQQQFDAGHVVHAGVKKNIIANQIGQQRPL